MDEYLAGKLPRQIFMENGFDIEILRQSRIEQSAYRWKRTYGKNGLIGLKTQGKRVQVDHYYGSLHHLKSSKGRKQELNFLRGRWSY